MADAEIHQLGLIRFHPLGKAVVIVLRGDPARAATDQHVAGFQNANRGVRAVELFGDYHLTGQARNFRERLEFGHFTSLSVV